MHLGVVKTVLEVIETSRKLRHAGYLEENELKILFAVEAEGWKVLTDMVSAAQSASTTGEVK